MQWWLRVLTVAGWPCLGVIVWSAPPIGSPMGFAFILATVVVPLATVLVILPRLLGDYFGAYILGAAKGAEIHEQECPHKARHLHAVRDS